MPQVITPTDEIIRHNLCRVLSSNELEEVSDSATIGTPGFF
jgi:hypothetical protein